MYVRKLNDQFTVQNEKEKTELIDKFNSIPFFDNECVGLVTNKEKVLTGIICKMDTGSDRKIYPVIGRFPILHIKNSRNDVIEHITFDMPTQIVETVKEKPETPVFNVTSFENYKNNTVITETKNVIIDEPVINEKKEVIEEPVNKPEEKDITDIHEEIKQEDVSDIPAETSEGEVIDESDEEKKKRGRRKRRVDNNN